MEKFTTNNDYMITLEIINDFKKKLDTFTHSNKEYENEIKIAFNTLFDEELMIIIQFYANNQDYKPDSLDGGYTNDIRNCFKKHFIIINAIKEKYGIK